MLALHQMGVNWDDAKKLTACSRCWVIGSVIPCFVEWFLVATQLGNEELWPVAHAIEQATCAQGSAAGSVDVGQLGIPAHKVFQKVPDATFPANLASPYSWHRYRQHQKHLMDNDSERIKLWHSWQLHRPGSQLTENLEPTVQDSSKEPNGCTASSSAASEYRYVLNEDGFFHSDFQMWWAEQMESEGETRAPSLDDVDMYAGGQQMEAGSLID